jgi:uncharacterized membrane protein
MNIIIAIIDWFHLLATVVWIGAMIILMLIIIPSARATLKDKNTFKEFMNLIGKKMTFLVNISIILLILTGIALGILLDVVTADWIVLLILKHIIVLAMVTIHICRIKIIAPRIGRRVKEDPSSREFLKLKTLQINLVWVNLTLGIIVLLFSVIL